MLETVTFALRLMLRSADRYIATLTRHNSYGTTSNDIKAESNGLGNLRSTDRNTCYGAPLLGRRESTPRGKCAERNVTLSLLGGVGVLRTRPRLAITSSPSAITQRASEKNNGDL